MDHRDFTELCVRGGKAYGLSELPERRLSRLLKDPDELLWQNLHRPVKIGHGTLMVEAELALVGGPVHVAYKRYRPRNWWKSLCWLFRRSRARRAWQLGHALLKRQIATARPLAMCEFRRFWLGRTSYLATEWIEAAENLHLAGWQWADRPSDQRLRWAAGCAESLGTDRTDARLRDRASRPEGGQPAGCRGG